MTSARISLPHSPRAPGCARSWLAERMLAWGRTEDIDTAMLVVDELVTNAIRYSTAPPVLIGHEVGGLLRCSVHDNDAARPVLLPPYRYAESGRGMWLVGELSYKWGVEAGGAYPGGKIVWCLLRPSETRRTRRSSEIGRIRRNRTTGLPGR